MGLLYYHLNLPPLVAEPFQFSLKYTERGVLSKDTAQENNEAARHAIWGALDWRRRLDEDKTQVG